MNGFYSLIPNSVPKLSTPFRFYLGLQRFVNIIDDVDNINQLNVNRRLIVDVSCCSGELLNKPTLAARHLFVRENITVPAFTVRAVRLASSC